MKSCITLKLILILLLFGFFHQDSYSQKISKSVQICSGAINGVLLERNGKNLVVYGDPKNKIKNAEIVLFTHFRRDVVWAGRKLLLNGSLGVAPVKEKIYFTKGDSIWSKFALTQFHDYNNETTKIGILPLKINRFVKGGEILKWQDIEIKVLDTPGYTRGSVSYIIDIDNKRFAFLGDLIYGNGDIFDLYSFQDSVRKIRGYFGYAARLGQLITSLQNIAKQKPDFLIPVRGPIIQNPDSAIHKLIQRIHMVYRNFLSISTLRWQSLDMEGTGPMDILSDHVLGPTANIDFMPLASVIKNPPSWCMHYNNTFLIVAQDSSAFLIDCGTKNAFQRLVELKQSGQIKSLDGIFITHYHDDHVNFLNTFINEFNCPIYLTSEIKDIIEKPSAYKMPCLTTSGSRKDLTVVKHGEKMSWKDFTLTFYYFPGQTLYHDAVFFEKNNGEKVFFTGDAFSLSGIGDFCLLNRNLLHPVTGYLHCLNILKKLPENVPLAHNHNDSLFSFSRKQLDYMTNVLFERCAIFKDLFPWDDINYGIDEQWIKIYPYRLKTIPGQTIEFSVKIFNHSNASKAFCLEPNVPSGFITKPRITTLIIEPLKEGEKIFRLFVPKKVIPEVSLLTVNVKFDNWDLREWGEAIIDILQ